MADVPVAAFDPIFWMHHCNIDRLLAIWQQLNWKLWFDKPFHDDPSPDSKLQPFHSDKMGDVWTSTKCRNTKDLHYQYDDLIPPSDAVDPETGEVDQEKYLAHLRAHIYKLYPSVPKTIKLQLGPPDGSEFNDYIINIVYDRYAIDRAYNIHFYVGDIPDDLSSGRRHPNYVGNVYTFSSPINACENCKDQKEGGILSKAQVPITSHLLVRALRAENNIPGAEPVSFGHNLETHAIEEYLEKNLDWVITALGDPTPRNKDEFPQTKVAVFKGTGRHAQEDGRVKLPSFKDYKLLPKATQGKKLGVGAGDPMVQGFE